MGGAGQDCHWSGGRGIGTGSSDVSGPSDCCLSPTAVTCPSHREYRACGPAEEPTCGSRSAAGKCVGLAPGWYCLGMVLQHACSPARPHPHLTKPPTPPAPRRGRTQAWWKAASAPRAPPATPPALMSAWSSAVRCLLSVPPSCLCEAEPGSCGTETLLTGFLSSLLLGCVGPDDVPRKVGPPPWCWGRILPQTLNFVGVGGVDSRTWEPQRLSNEAFKSWKAELARYAPTHPSVPLSLPPPIPPSSAPLSILPSPVSLSATPPSLCLTLHPSLHPSVHPSIHPSVCVSLHPANHLTLCLSLHSSIHISSTRPHHPPIAHAMLCLDLR